MENYLMMADYTYQRDLRTLNERSFGGVLSFFAKFGSDNMKNNRI